MTLTQYHHFTDQMDAAARNGDRNELIAICCKWHLPDRVRSLVNPYTMGAFCMAWEAGTKEVQVWAFDNLLL